MSIPEDERNLQYKFLSFYVRINDKELEGNKSSRFCVISSKTVSLTSNRDWVWHSLGKKKRISGKEKEYLH